MSVVRFASLSRPVPARPTPAGLRELLRAGVPATIIGTVLSAVLFTRPVLAHLGRVPYGVGTDPATYVWALRWWPHSVGAGLNPLRIHLFWGGIGYDPLWWASIPGLSLLATPLTATVGPIAALNILSMLAPALAGGAVASVGRAIGLSPSGRTLAGALFVLSPFEATAQSHLHVAFAAPVILALAIALNSAWQPRLRCRDVLATAGCLIIAVLTSPEQVLTMSTFGAVLLLCGLRVPPLRQRSGRVATTALLALGTMALVTAPVLLNMVFDGPGEIHVAAEYGNDLLNVVLPTQRQWLGQGTLGHPSVHWVGNLGTRGGYLGPVTLVVLAYVVLRGLDLRRRWLLITALLTLLASLGPEIAVGGNRLVPSPLHPLFALSLFENTIPGLMTLYTWIALTLLLADVVVSLGRPVGTVVGSCLVLSILPSLSSAVWQAPVFTPRYYAGQTYRADLRGQTVLELPVGDLSLLVPQEQDDFGFRSAWGWAGPLPPQLAPVEDVVPAMLSNQPAGITGRSLACYMRATKTTIVVTVDGVSDPDWRRLLTRLGARAHADPGVTTYRITGAIRSRC